MPVSALYIARSTEIAARLLGGEMMIMSARDSTLFNLNEVGTAIWEAADGVTPLEEIVERKVCAEFEVEQRQPLRTPSASARRRRNGGFWLAAISRMRRML